jgi:uncharacterized protein YbgA (DUF1722 family)/uncharacterized protein YbbK (DUF523 family)
VVIFVECQFLTYQIQFGDSCLLGNEVRHDGGHKRNVYVVKTLSDYFNFRPSCPEMAIGLGVPRPTIRLNKAEEGVRLVGTKNSELDLTDDMNNWSEGAIPAMHDLSGFILKSNSPSCGMERVRLYGDKGMPTRDGTGLFAASLMRAMPWLPVEEEGRLNDATLRENFIERVFIYYRWQRLIDDGLSVSALMEFHQRHKYILLAHEEVEYRKLGPLIASANKQNLEEIADEYLLRMMNVLKARASRKRHTNVLMHVMGYLKNKISGDDKQEMIEVMDNYRLGRVPLIVPVTLMKHHLRRYPDEYIDKQYYMMPYPEELMLRNMI